MSTPVRLPSPPSFSSYRLPSPTPALPPLTLPLPSLSLPPLFSFPSLTQGNSSREGEAEGYEDWSQQVQHKLKRCMCALICSHCGFISIVSPSLPLPPSFSVPPSPLLSLSPSFSSPSPLLLQQGIKFLQSQGKLGESAEAVALFLFKGELLNKRKIGGYLGEG